MRRLLSPLRRFLQIESASGALLVICTIIALALTNSPWAATYYAFWQTPVVLGAGPFIINESLHFWINDVLMVIFFFVVGLEIKREIVGGELSEWRKAALPVLGAVGGMVAPASIYLLFHATGSAQRGWGIPMATDIAFVVGAMALFGRRVPAALKVFLLALAIADDIGAVLVIAIAYTQHLAAWWLCAGLVGLFVIIGLERLGVRSIKWYVFVGAWIWLAFHQAHVHPTVAGVVLGLLAPAQPLIKLPELRESLGEYTERLHGDEPAESGKQFALLEEIAWTATEAVSPLARLEHGLHQTVAFVIMPIFVLANAGVPIGLGLIGDPIALAVAAGLLFGKPIGILAVAFISVRLKLAQLPAGCGWLHVLAAGCLAGIGFTMAIFVAGLAFPEATAPKQLEAAKVGVFVGSVVSAAVGAALLAWATKADSSN